MFVINGGGSARPDLERKAAGLDQRPLRRSSAEGPAARGAGRRRRPRRAAAQGLARASVPSKMYSILAAGRPIVASVDPGTEVATVGRASGRRASTVPPDDPEAFTKAIARLRRSDEPRRSAGRARWAPPGALVVRRGRSGPRRAAVAAGQYEAACFRDASVQRSKPSEDMAGVGPAGTSRHSAGQRALGAERGTAKAAIRYRPSVPLELHPHG